MYLLLFLFSFIYNILGNINLFIIKIYIINGHTVEPNISHNCNKLDTNEDTITVIPLNNIVENKL